MQGTKKPIFRLMQQSVLPPGGDGQSMLVHARLASSRKGKEGEEGEAVGAEKVRREEALAFHPFQPLQTLADLSQL